MSEVGTDSLTDLLSNTVGVLVLLCFMGVVETDEVKFRISPEMLRLEGIYPITDDGPGVLMPAIPGESGYEMLATTERSVDTDRNSFIVSKGHIKSLRPVIESLSDLDKGTREIKAGSRIAFKGSAEYKLGRVSFVLEDSEEFPGEPVEAFLSGKGSCVEEIKALDPKNDHVFLHIASDSFGYYLPLRDHIRKLGIEVGWWVTGESGDNSFSKMTGNGTIGSNQYRFVLVPVSELKRSID